MIDISCAKGPRVGTIRGSVLLHLIISFWHINYLIMQSIPDTQYPVTNGPCILVERRKKPLAYFHDYREASQ